MGFFQRLEWQARRFGSSVLRLEEDECALRRVLVRQWPALAPAAVDLQFHTGERRDGLAAHYAISDDREWQHFGRRT